MSLYLGENLISGIATPIEPTRNIGQIIQSTIPLTDAGLHLLDGSLIQGGGIYDDFVQYIAGLVNTYPQCFCSEAEWQQSVNTYGVCGKFVYSNNSVRLPKITGFIEGTVDSNALGDLVTAGLPNITGFTDWWSYGTGTNNPTGAFYSTLSANNSPDSGSNPGQLLSFDASRSSSIYGNSNTVQPQSIKVFYYIVIATTTKTDIEVDIDEIVTDLNALTGQMSNLNTLVQQMSIVFNNLYPVGSVYLGIQNNGTCPIASLIPGSTWELVSQDRALWGGNGTNANSTIAAGLPNITGYIRGASTEADSSDYAGGVFVYDSNKNALAKVGSNYWQSKGVNFDASRSSSVYGNSSTVQPPAYVVNIWVRTA